MTNITNNSKLWEHSHDEAANRVLVGLGHKQEMLDETIIWAWKRMEEMEEVIKRQQEDIKELQSSYKDV